MSTLIEGARLEFKAGRSDKFWEWRIYEDGTTTTVYELRFTWGRNGTRGQSTSERMTDKILARWKAAARENEKIRKGYRRVGLERIDLEKPRPEVRRVPLAAVRLVASVKAVETPPLVMERRIRLK